MLHARDVLLVGCLSSQKHASVSQGRICTDNFTCCHTEIEAADQTFHLTQSQYTDTGSTNPSADPITPGAWQGSLTQESKPEALPSQRQPPVPMLLARKHRSQQRQRWLWGSPALFLDLWKAHVHEFGHDRIVNKDGASKHLFAAKKIK